MRKTSIMRLLAALFAIHMFFGACALAATYRLGDEADEIATIQSALKQLKFYTGDITGHYGAKTEDAIRKFQRRYNLEADGIAGKETIEKLYDKAGIAASGSGSASSASSSGSSSSSASSSLLRYGSEGDSVRTLQQNLTSLGYYTGSITGHYGSKTEAAVAAFQRANGLSADGIAGAKTLQKIADRRTGKASSSSETSAASESASAAPASGILKYGTQSEAVRTLQQNLKTLGFYSGNITGNFGTLTKTAVAAFQRANGLSADGIAGTKTLAAIAKKVNGAPSSSSSSSSSGSGMSLNTSVTLHSGLKNDSNVKKLQQMLKSLGYYNGSVTGTYGSKTKEAVEAFQRAKGLSADGIAGTKTLAAINADYASGTTSGSSSSSVRVNASNVRYDSFYNWRNRYSNGEYCTVYDPSTGLSWKLRIMTKDAHMDAEPVTSADTATMNKAFGNKTTWTPKVVYVTFSDGRVYIGSTHNTPHGTQKISSSYNNFKGHLCVHFPMPMERAQAIGSYAVSHQEAINAAWAKLGGSGH